MNRVYPTGLFSDPVWQTLTPGARLVYICVCQYALSGHQKKSSIPMQEISVMSGASLSQIETAMRSLESSGLAEVRANGRVVLLRDREHFGVIKAESFADKRSEYHEITEELCSYLADILPFKRVPKATPSRIATVSSLARKGYSLQDMKAAAKGCQMSKWHIENQYFRFENIFGSLEKFERHLERGLTTKTERVRKVILQTRSSHIERLRGRTNSQSEWD